MTPTNTTEQPGEHTDARDATTAHPKRPWDAPLPSITLPTDTDTRAPVAKLLKLSQRGKLAGFEKHSDTRFSVAAHGTVYDRILHGNVSNNTIAFEGQLKTLLPTIVIIGFALAIFPGVNLTHTMLAVLIPFYNIGFWWTVAWYLPLMLIAIPTLRKQFRTSELASRAHAEETIAKLAAHLNAEVVPPSTHRPA